jgi:hypothetical protein
MGVAKNYLQLSVLQSGRVWESLVETIILTPISELVKEKQKKDTYFVNHKSCYLYLSMAMVGNLNNVTTMQGCGNYVFLSNFCETSDCYNRL